MPNPPKIEHADRRRAFYRDNTAAYLDSWRGIIHEDRKAVVMAATAAQKAVDYITNAHAIEQEEAA